jgi:hypothetical protein
VGGDTIEVHVARVALPARTDDAHLSLVKVLLSEADAVEHGLCGGQTFIFGKRAAVSVPRFHSPYAVSFYKIQPKLAFLFNAYKFFCIFLNRQKKTPKNIVFLRIKPLFSLIFAKLGNLV